MKFNVTTGVAICAFLLSLVNTYFLSRRNKVLLKVNPQHYTPTGMYQTEHWNFRIEVINLSEFPVVIVDIGFQLTDKNHVTKIPLPNERMYSAFPRVLDPHRSCSVYFWLDVNSVELAKVKCAYAKTECDTERRGTSFALCKLVKEAKEAVAHSR